LVIKSRFELENSCSPEERIITECRRTDIIEYWEFPEEKKVRCKWVMFEKAEYS